MASNFTDGGSFFPSGASCFGNALLAVGPGGCPVTDDMVSFLNLTSNFHKNYLTAYCAVGAPQDDGCPYGFCPNSDIAGPLVRISTYLTNIFVAILIFYQKDREEINENFWAQILSLYTLLFSCGISILLSSLTRFHAIITLAMAGSPLTFYIFVYALRSIIDGKHRLASALGKGRYLPRVTVLTALGIWIALLVYVLLPSGTHFSQRSCENAFEGINKLILRFFFLLPVLLFIALPTDARWVVALPGIFTALAWIIAIFRKRRVIWPVGKPYRPRFRKVWQTVRDSYPFIQFMSIVFLPFVYWVGTIEMALVANVGANDDNFSASFGQVLAVFVTVPPMIAVAKQLPRFCIWFFNLTWIRFLMCGRRRKVALESESSENLSYFHSAHSSTDSVEYLGEKPGYDTVKYDTWAEGHNTV